MADVIKSYLVSLGFEVDQAQFRKTQETLKAVAVDVTSYTGGMARDILKFQIAATSAFIAVSAGVLGYIDKLAASDQQMRLFAMRSFMTLEQARSVKMALDTLGVSLDDVAWDKELHKRFTTLIEDQKQLAAILGPGYEDQLKQVRDLRFELSRLELKGEYFGFKFASDLLKKLGIADGTLVGSLKELNDYVLANLPKWSDELTDDVIPVLQETKTILLDTWAAAKEGTRAIQTFVGVLAGDESLQSADVNLASLGRTFQYIAHWIGFALEQLTAFEQMLGHLASSAGNLVGGVKDWFGGREDEGDRKLRIANKEFWAADSSMSGPVDLSRGLTSPGLNAPASAVQAWRPRGNMDTGAGTGTIDFDRMAAAVEHIESGGHQFGKDGNVLTSRAGALGVMQLMPKTAAGLGVDPNNETQNRAGGRALLQALFKKYGNWDQALAAYNWGEGNVDKMMAHGGRLPGETSNYVRDVEAYAQRGAGGPGGGSPVSIGSIPITITQPGATPDQVRSAVKEGVSQALAQRDVRSQATLGGVYR